MDEATHKLNFKPISLRALIMGKNPKIGRWIPRFVYRFLSQRKKGVIRDVEWQKSIITKARQTKRDIIPIHVSGRCSNFFYNLANTRKFLGIKTNIEMFFLPNESYKHRNKHFVITFGKAIPYQTFDKRFSPLQWAAGSKIIFTHCLKIRKADSVT